MSAVRCVVSGAAGFVGSHLCDRLVQTGHRVVGIDDYSTGSRRNVDHLIEHPNFQILEHDITEPFPTLEADQFYNLACPASPVHYQRDPIKTVVTNVEGTIHGLRLAQAAGARFLQASTSEVYGDPDVHPQREDYRGNVNPIGPRACYDEGKRCAETLCFDFHRQAGVEIRVARIFNTYGPRMAFDDGRVISNFIVQTLRGEDLTVYGDGSQTRSFCYVDDLVSGLILLMNHGSETGPVNLGNPREFTMLELAEKVLQIAGSQGRITHRPLPQDDPRQRQPDIGRARSQLGFEATVSLEDGLARTIEDFRARMARES